MHKVTFFFTIFVSVIMVFVMGRGDWSLAQPSSFNTSGLRTDQVAMFCNQSFPSPRILDQQPAMAGEFDLPWFGIRDVLLIDL